MLEPRRLTADRILNLRWSIEHARKKNTAIVPLALEELEALLDTAEACTCRPLLPGIEERTA